MKKIAVFDFDGTLYNGDSLINFCLFVYKKYPWRSILIFYQLYSLILNKIGIITKSKLKERFLVFLMNFDEGLLNSLLIEFWRNQIPVKFNEVLIQRVKELQHIGIEIFCVTASPYEFVEIPLQKIGIANIISTRIQIKKGRYTLMGKNCRGIEKLNRLNLAFPDNDCTIVEAYSDNSDDLELLQKAQKGYLLRHGKVLKQYINENKTL
jgi:HAD superfamily phosphoserine phosphatase-like hydrolase